MATKPEPMVSGGALLAYFQSFNYEEIRPLLKKHQLDPIDPAQWYPQELVLNFYKAIQDGHYNLIDTYVSIGMKLIQVAPFPPNVRSVEDALKALEPFYDMNHRNTTGQGWKVEMTGAKQARIVNNDPYPDEIGYGIVWGLMKRFLPSGHHFTVTSSTQGNSNVPVYDVKWD